MNGAFGSQKPTCRHWPLWPSRQPVCIHDVASPLLISVTNSDPSGLTQTGLSLCDGSTDNECGSTFINQAIYGTGCDTACNAAIDSQPIGTLGDFFSGAVNDIYGTFRTSVATSTVLLGLPQIGLSLASHLPSRIPIGNPNTVAYSLGQVTPDIAALFTGAGELDALGAATSFDLAATGTDLEAPNAASIISRVRSSISQVLSPDTTAYAHTAEGGSAVYRTARVGLGQAELRNGLDPANFATGDQSAYVGDEVAARTLANPNVGSYENFYIRFEMQPDFESELAKYKLAIS